MKGSDSMTVSTFRKNNSVNAVTIPLSKVSLVMPCHLKAVENGDKVSTLLNEPMVIVHKVKSKGEETYNLIMGYRDYITAKNNEQDTVKAILVTSKTRASFNRKLCSTVETVDTSTLYPPDHWTAPNEEKVKACINAYNETGSFGKKVIVSPKGKILDGYAAVCAAKVLKVEKIKAHIIPENFFYQKKKEIKKCA